MIIITYNTFNFEISKVMISKHTLIFPRSFNSSFTIFLKSKDDSTCRDLIPITIQLCAEDDLEVTHFVISGEAAKP